MIQLGLIDNLPVTKTNIVHAIKIYGPNTDTIKGKAIRTKPPMVVEDEIKISQVLEPMRQSIVIDADLMFLNKMPFLISVTQRIVFTTIEWIKDGKTPTLANELDHVLTFYKIYGCKVKQLIFDIDFKNKKIEKVLGEHQVMPNWCEAKEHALRIKCRIRMFK